MAPDPKVCVLSAIYGESDKLWEHADQDTDVDWVLVSDRPRKSHTWRVVVEPQFDLANQLASRHPKCLPERYTDAEIVLWLDAQFEITGRGYVARMVELLGDADKAMFAHPFFSWRDEAEGSLRGARYAGHDLIGQMATFEDPHQHWAAGVSVRRMTDAMKAFGQEWWETLVKWDSGKDQVSMAPLLARHDLQVATIPGTYRNFPGLKLHGHVGEPASAWAMRLFRAKAKHGWRCPFCRSVQWPWDRTCTNSWISGGEWRGCKGAPAR